MYNGKSLTSAFVVAHGEIVASVKISCYAIRFRRSEITAKRLLLLVPRAVLGLITITNQHDVSVTL